MTTSSLHGTARPSESAPAARRRAWCAAALASLLITGCGGGGSGPEPPTPPATVVGPPTVAASIVATAAEAQAATPAALAAADAAAARVGAMSGFTVLTGGPLFHQSADGSDRRRIQSVPAPTMHALSVQTASCAELMDNASCSGSATLDTNIADTATSIRAGDYADMSFASLSGPLGGLQVTLDGRMRIDFNSALDLNSTTFPGLDILVTFERFSGSANGVAFGPVSDAARLQVGSQGNVTLTAGGASFSGLSGVTFSSAGNYAIGAGTARVAYWSDGSRYVDITLSNWQVVNGRPAVGSQATVTAGQGSAAIAVTAASTTTVTYAVGVTVAGATSRFVVTATYPAGGGAPSYAVAGG